LSDDIPAAGDPPSPAAATISEVYNMPTSFLRAMFGAVLLAGLLVAGAPARAEDLAAIDPNADVTAVPGWRVSGLSGDASARVGSAPFMRLAIGDLVPVGSDIRTGHRAVVFLSRRGDRIVIQPDTELHIAAPQAGGLLTQFFQSFGNVFYDVEPRSNRSFGVKSPYMAAVVKGTRFLVTVKRDLNSVRVDEGRVLVASSAGDSSVLVGAGSVATVKRSGEGGVQMTESAIVVPPAVTTTPAITTKTTAPAGSVDDAQGAAGDAANAAGNTAGGATNTAGSATNTAGGVVGGAVNAVGGVAGAAGEVVGGVAGAAGEVVGDVADTAGDVVGGVTETAGGLLGGLGKAVGGLLGRR
jgi:FecR protein